MQIKDILYRQKDNEKIAIEYRDEKISYSQMHKRVKKNAEFILREAKCLSCNNIGMFLPNCISYAIGYFTIAYLDRVIVPIEISLSKPEFLSVINYCEIGMVITDCNYLVYIQDFCKGGDGASGIWQSYHMGKRCWGRSGRGNRNDSGCGTGDVPAPYFFRI